MSLTSYRKLEINYFPAYCLVGDIMQEAASYIQNTRGLRVAGSSADGHLLIVESSLISVNIQPMWVDNQVSTYSCMVDNQPCATFYFPANKPPYMITGSGK